MYYVNDEYPYSNSDLPLLPDLLDHVEWDVVCIFDACRWDAFEEMCDESEPVSSTVGHTFDWVEHVVGDSDRDWSDVTYISGNLMTSAVADQDNRDVVLDNQVNEHIQGYHDHDVLDRILGTTRPSELSHLAFEHEPPIVIHYMQPHNPFIGDVTVNASPASDTELDLSEPDKMSGEAQLVKEGHVSLEMYRVAYLENLKLVWNATEKVRESYEKVITTADHGEVLGPDQFGHGGKRNQGGIVPFHTNWDVDLPSSTSVNASSEHEWVTQSTESLSQPDSDTDDEQELIDDDELEDKLRALGYTV